MSGRTSEADDAAGAAAGEIGDQVADHVVAFGKIWTKATGGAAVALDPDLPDPAAEFSVEPAPGVREAVGWLRAGLQASSNQRFVFLVGGPGGGKSHAIGAATDGFEEEPAGSSGLAQRKYRFRASDQWLTVVNDASIRSSTDRTPLTDDINEAATGGDSLFGCVNRGILVEEAHELSEDSVGAAVVRWLAGIDQLPNSEHALTPLPQTALLMGSATIDIAGKTVELLAVHVDFCSLLEPRPAIGEDLKPAQYKVTRLKDRPALEIDAMPAGSLLDKVTAYLADATLPEPSGHNPIKANVESLSRPEVQRGVLSVLRASEVVAGGRMTFREVWGAIVRALVRDAPSAVGPEALGNFLPPCADLSPYEVFVEMRDRAGLRFSEGLIGVGDAPEEVASDPVLRFTAAVDPVIDAAPGQFNPGKPDQGWATPVLDAFSGLVTSASPLDTLIDLLPASDSFHHVVTAFDRNLDDAFVAATQPEGADDQQRRQMAAWYGDYLTRLYALSNGISAFLPEVSAWLEARRTMPSKLAESLTTLLRPTRDPLDAQSGYFLPLFSSRTIPITGAPPEAQFVVKGESVVSLEPQRRGDEVTLAMREGNEVVGEIELDFALIRSALACSGQRLGVTEQAPRVGPRVERFRAKRLTSDRVATSTFRMVQGNETIDVDLINDGAED